VNRHEGKDIIRPAGLDGHEKKQAAVPAVSAELRRDGADVLHPDGASGSPVLGHMSGGTSSTIILRLGTVVIAVFALIFLFYTHSFLIRRREREFGLYNVLGMGKGNIARILLWETVITYGLTTGTGLLLGMVLYKLAELGMVRLLQVPVTYTLTVSVSSLLAAAALFAAIHTLILLNGLRQLHGVSAVGLLRSESVGEKPPKAQWVLTAAGAVLLAGAYWRCPSGSRWRR